MACLGTTKDGQPCQRNPEVGEQYCWQHTNGFLKKSTLFIASILGVKRRFLIWLIIFSIGVFLLQTYASNKINYRLDQLEFKPNIEMEVSPYLKQDKFGEYLPLIIYNTGDFTFKDIYFAITSCGMDNLYDQYHLPILPAHSQKEIPFGNKHVIDEKHIKVAKDGIVMANSGHFDVEINKIALKKLSKKIRTVRKSVEEYDLGKKKIYLLAEGRLVNLGAADGHPASVMDMSFAGQAMAAEYMWKNKGKLENKVHTLPAFLDNKIAQLKLKSEGIKIDILSDEQKKYLSSWNEGT